MNTSVDPTVTVTFAGCGDAFGSGGRYQACIHLHQHNGPIFILDCGATSLSALKRLGLDPSDIRAVFISHLHGDHFGGLPFLILDGQFADRHGPLTIAGPRGVADRLHQLMEAMFPGSTNVPGRFDVEVVELGSESPSTVAGIEVTSWEVNHPCGAPPLALRLRIGDKIVAYTGDTAWTDDLARVAGGADLLIAEAYQFDKMVPYHLRHADLVDHRQELAAGRIVLTHMSADMLARRDQAGFDTAHDGLSLQI
jgi:ribonuclease BN (tRNA processing enzyme)